MKKILVIAVVFLFIVLLTNLANRVPADAASGTAFSLKAQKVIACSSHEIVLVDPHQKATRLDKDESWPECAAFQGNQVEDFYLSEGPRRTFWGLRKPPGGGRRCRLAGVSEIVLNRTPKRRSFDFATLRSGLQRWWGICRAGVKLRTGCAGR